MEGVSASYELRMGRIEHVQGNTETQLIELRLLLEDQADRGRRNNLRIKGVREVKGPENLHTTLQALFQQMLAPMDGANYPVRLDRVYRITGSRMTDSTQPRDIVCQLHHFHVKDMLSQKAWQDGPFNFQGGTVTILPDLSRPTLQRRAMLRPLLDLLRTKGCMYRWGFPFHLIVHSENLVFTLRHTRDLPALFEFLDTPSIEVPNWLKQVSDPTTPSKTT